MLDNLISPPTLINQQAKSVTTPRGLSQEQALEGIQSHPKFKVGSVIKSIRQKQDRWEVRLLEPKTAAPPPFPPKDDEESDGPSAVEEAPEAPDEDGDSADEEDSPSDSSDGPPSDKKPKEGGEIKEVLTLLHTLLDALGLGAGPEGPDAGPPAPPPGPPGAAGAPEHGGARPGAGRPPGPGAGGGAPTRPMRDVPPGANPIAGFASARDMAAQIPSFTAAADDDGKTTVKQAKAELDAIYSPYYKVKQLKQANGKMLALLSVR
jgi:hypothetical protein